MNRLTRRETLGAVAAAGTALSIHELARPWAARETGTRAEQPGGSVETMVAISEVVYPWVLDSPEGRFGRYLASVGEERTAATRAAAVGLDDAARAAFGVRFTALSVAERRTLLRILGVDRVLPRPEGTLPERIRFHLVNSTLYALSVHPSGTEPFGLRNPVGHPGGFERKEGSR